MASDEKRPRAFSTLDGRQLPPIYDEVYDIICPNNENRISGEVFVLAMANTGVSRVQLREIWDIVHHTKTGSLDRDQFNRALAYVAMCQNGETPTADKMDLWIEPPTPKLNDLATIVALEGNASKVLMDYTYRELEEDDFVQVTVEEKKGGNLLKKHTNYSIYSKRCNKTVVRRYSEFENIESLLKKRYPYRVIIALPKKGHGLGTPSPEFIDARRVALEMFLRYSAYCRTPSYAMMIS